MEVSSLPPAQDEPVARCKRCKEEPGTIKMRTELVCPTCFASFIGAKVVKRMEVLNRTTRSTSQATEKRTMLLGLSFGPSSTCLFHVLHSSAERNEAKKRRGGVVEYVAVHVDTSLEPSSSEMEDLRRKYDTHFPLCTTVVVPLSKVLSIPGIDWTNLPALDKTLDSPEAQLSDIFSRLPSTTSRGDILRLFVRHVLLSEARERGCATVLMGHTTTSLAEVTLSEAAKGRGFAVPWLVGDGEIPLPASIDATSPEEGLSVTTTTLPLYHPLRDVLRTEVNIYTTAATSPPLTTIIPPSLHPIDGKAAPRAVVSHKDVSIEEVMLRYFVDVEANYPSIVANVVRTSAKLERPSLKGGVCGLCRLGMDEVGDERWRGEMGLEPEEKTEERKGDKLCYGCERSVGG